MSGTKRVKKINYSLCYKPKETVKIMTVEIKIEIEVDEGFDKQELRSDILNSFPERTGYDVRHIEIELTE